MEKLATLDWLLIGAYFAVILGVAWWVAGRKKSTHESSKSYFLAGRDVGWDAGGAGRAMAAATMRPAEMETT